MSVLGALARIGNQAIAAIGGTWSRFWFKPKPTTRLEIIRIGIGTALLLHYGMATPFLFDLWGDGGWMPRNVALQQLSNSWMQSVFYYFTAPWQWIAFHIVFLLCCAALVVGWRTSWVKWIVLIGHISYDYRNIIISYGADSVTASLMFVLCLAPIGRAMSLDRVRAVRAAKRGNLQADVPPYVSPWAGACTRLMQIQMVVLFFFSGIEKIRGDEWWSGDAIWSAFTVYEFYNNALVWLLAHQYWLVTVGSYGTIFIELAYAFLIWQHRTRPYVLSAAVFLHLSFGFGLGLIYFSFIMIIGHMSFLRQQWLTRLGLWWKQKAGPIDVVYDSTCTACVRSLVWLLPFDGWKQITVRDIRTDTRADDPPTETTIAVALPDGQRLRGFEAYRHIAARAPGLWWQIPLFYVPLLNRVFGRRTLKPMSAKPHRHPKGLVYLAMSLFVGWHSLAMIIAPAPYGSPIIEGLHAMVRPYLSLFRLESAWTFFTNVAAVKLPQFRYVVTDAEGNEHTFIPVLDFKWYHPRYNWFERIYWSLMDQTDPEKFGNHLAPKLCHQHAAIRPVEITFQSVRPGDFWPDDQLAGYHPLDPEYSTTYTLMSVACPT